MDRNFPIIDSSATLQEAIKRLDRDHEAFIVIKEGRFYTLLDEDDLFRGIFNGSNSERIEEISIEKHFKFVSLIEGIEKVLDLMKEGKTEFVLVKDKDKILGVISQKDIISMQEDLLKEIPEPGELIENTLLPVKCEKCLFRNAVFVIGRKNICEDCI